MVKFLIIMVLCTIYKEAKGLQSAMSDDIGLADASNDNITNRAIMIGGHIVVIDQNRITSYDRHTLVDTISIEPAFDYRTHKFIVEKRFERLLVQSAKENRCYIISLTFSGKIVKEIFSCNLENFQHLIGCNNIIVTQNHETVHFFNFESRRINHMKSQVINSHEMILDISKIGKLYFLVTNWTIYHLDNFTLSLIKVTGFHNQQSHAFMIEVESQMFFVLIHKDEKEVLFYRYLKNLEFSEYFKFKYEGVFVFSNSDYIIVQSDNYYHLYSIGNLLRFKNDEVYSLPVETKEKLVGTYKDKKNQGLTVIVETLAFDIGVYDVKLTEIELSAKKEDSSTWSSLFRRLLFPIVISIGVVVFTYAKVLKGAEQPKEGFRKVKEFLKQKESINRY